MVDRSVRIFPLGDSAITVEFGNTISPELNTRAIALTEHFTRNPFPGFVEAVPAYTSATVFYDLIAVSRADGGRTTAFDRVRAEVEAALKSIDTAGSAAGRLIEIPVAFDLAGEYDLAYVGERAGLAPSEVVERFVSATYRVYMLGFLPGFTYMGEVDETIATPRKETPRTKVPAGSVGIAGRQTGIYSLESPGGWQIIGRTSVPLFTPGSETPTLLQAGDQVRFTVAQ